VSRKYYDYVRRRRHAVMAGFSGKEAKQFLPLFGPSSTFQETLRAIEGTSADPGFVTLQPEFFARATAKSIDYAVMERTERSAVLPVSYGWSDALALGRRSGNCRNAMRTATQPTATPSLSGRAVHQHGIIRRHHHHFVEAEQRHDLLFARHIWRTGNSAMHCATSSPVSGKSRRS
jgi:hypothetical protein